MTRHRASAPDRGGRGRLLLRLQATLVGLLCFSAGAVPRLLPALLGVLALVAAIHVFTVDPKRPLMLLRTAFGIALAVFIAYLFINATWAPDREAGLAKAATVLGLAVGPSLSPRPTLCARAMRRACSPFRLSPVSCSGPHSY